MNSSSPDERSDLIDEFLFLTIKYVRVMNDVEFYDRLKDSFWVPSFSGERHRNKLYDDAKAEQKRLSIRMEDIRRALITGE